MDNAIGFLRRDPLYFDPVIAGRLGVGPHRGIEARDILFGSSQIPQGQIYDALRGGQFADFLLRRASGPDIYNGSHWPPPERGPYREIDQRRVPKSPYGRSIQEDVFGIGRNYEYPYKGHIVDCGWCNDDLCEHNMSYSNGNSSSSSSRDTKTKDIVIRGHTHKVRKSFLAEASKFEAEIVKLLDKKSEAQMPDNIVRMMVDYINTESCTAANFHDLVTLNVLASSLGVKSAVEYSLHQIKKGLQHGYDIDASELTQICITTLMSSKVDDTLREWLKTFLQADKTAYRLRRHPSYISIVRGRPEVDARLLTLLGQIKKDDYDKSLRIL